jgi:hypothetical protein
MQPENKIKPENLTQAKLAWILWEISEQLAHLLWKNFEEEFFHILNQRQEQSLQRLSDRYPIE